MNYCEEDKAVISLNLIPYLGYGQFQKLIVNFGSAPKILEASEKEISKVEGINSKLAKAIAEAKSSQADEEIKEAGKIGARILTYNAEEYPEPLRNIFDFPPVLYFLGNIKKENLLGIALIGTRRPTPYGVSVARVFAKTLAKNRITCVSGLARGIDSEVHKTCLEEGGRTLAVLGNGLNKHYPPENRKLEQEIIKNGCLISEFPLSAIPDKANFPRRNRIISALSLATVVLEADEKSGSLITARYAMEQGKEVFAVPGPIFSKYSKGTNSLIKNGALVAESSDDVIESLSPFQKLLSRKEKPIIKTEDNPCFGNVESRILSILEDKTEGTSIDLITQKLGIPISETAASLLGLELKGIIRSLPGKNYIKSH